MGKNSLKTPLTMCLTTHY